MVWKTAKSCQKGRRKLKSKNTIPTSYFASIKQLRRMTPTFLGQHCFFNKKFSLPAPSCATAILAVPEHGQDGRGTSLVAASPRCIYLNQRCSKVNSIGFRAGRHWAVPMSIFLDKTDL
jgi:hypothetical protein